MNLKHICATTILVATLSAKSADVTRVQCSSLKMETAFGSVMIACANDGKLADLRVVSNDGQVVVVPRTELADIESPVLQRLSIHITQRKQIQSLKDLGDTDSLIVSLSFGDWNEIVVSKEDSEGYVKLARVKNRVYYIFSNIGYSHRDQRTCLGRDPVWALHTKEPGKKEIEDGTEAMEFPSPVPNSPPSLPVKN